MASTKSDPEFDPRRAAEPGQVFTFNDAEGTFEVTADEDGIVWPKSQRHVVALDAFDLPVARKALAEAKADATPEPTAAKATADTAGDAGKEG